MFTAYLSSIHY